MDSLFLSTLTKLLLPAIGIMIVILVSKKLSHSWLDDLGLQMPESTKLIGWIGFWIIWIIVSEILIKNFGLEQAKNWPTYPIHILVMRVFAIGIIGPFCEEIVTRGLIFHQLQRNKFTSWGAIIIISILWTIAHYQYRVGTLILIFTDGLIFGLSRYNSRSVLTPIVMHIVGNLFSIYQSVSI